jgi:hypothetical protein
MSTSRDLQRSTRALVRFVTALAAVIAAATAAAPAGRALAAERVPVFVAAPSGVAAAPVATKQGAAAELALDDGTWEGTVSVPGAQFLWFNRFPVGASAFELQEVQVLFPSASGLNLGDAVQIVVWRDPDGDPGNGADLLRTLDATIQAVDGASFSAYAVDPAIVVPAGNDLLVGVINRYVVGGVPADTFPAAIDTTDPRGRSWFATWSGDPPDPPSLPSDAVTSPIDAFVAGNWMIRAVGLELAAAAIPDLQPVGAAVLIGLLTLGGAALLLRRVR